MHSWVAEWGGHYWLNIRFIHANGPEALEEFERRVWAAADPGSEKCMREESIPEEVKALLID